MRLAPSVLISLVGLASTVLSQDQGTCIECPVKDRGKLWTTAKPWTQHDDSKEKRPLFTATLNEVVKASGFLHDGFEAKLTLTSIIHDAKITCFQTVANNKITELCLWIKDGSCTYDLSGLNLEGNFTGWFPP